MKKILLLNLLLAMLFGVQSVKADVVFNSTNFPDPAFRQYLQEKYYFPEGETLPQNDLDEVGDLKLGSRGISTLKGVEHFRFLKALYCEGNNLTSLDLSKNAALHTVVCNGNQLTELVLPNLRFNPSGYTIISCSHNNLSSLRVPVDVTTILQLDCRFNKLNELIITAEYKIDGADVDCSHNNLSNIDIGEKVYLWKLNCSYNNFTSLDLNGQKSLNNLELNCSHNNITQLENLWRLTNLRKLDISYNKLNGNIGLAAGLTNLADLDCSGNDYTYIILQYLTGLERFTMNDSKVTSIDFSYNTKLHYLNMNNNTIDELRLLQNAELDTVIVNNCNLKKLLFTNAANKMKHLECYSNQLTSLWLYDQPQLKCLNCEQNQLTTLNYKSMPQLETFVCSHNRFTSLDITGLKSLKWFYAHHNRLLSIGGVDMVGGPNWENYNADAFTPQEPTTRRFERIPYNGGEAWALYLGISDASRILNFKKDDVAASPVIENKYLIVSDDLNQIPQKVEYDFKPYATKNAFHVVVNYDVKDYNIFVDGQKMTSLNFFDIPGLVSGTAYFEDKPEDLGWAGEPTLVLDNATLEWDGNNYGIYNNDNYHFTIKVIGDCTIKVPNTIALGLDVATVTTIEGGGTLNIISGSYPIETAIVTWLTIQDNTTVIARNITGNSALWDQDGAKIEIRDGGVFAAYSKYEPIWLDSNGEFIFGEGIALRYPVGAYVGSGNNIYNADGTKVMNDWVVIGPDNQATQDLIDGVDIVNADDNLNANLNANKGIYNLTGQKVGESYKGIVIKDGKKVLR
jgi:Leucine-rich repeat (LRR) protein